MKNISLQKENKEGDTVSMGSIDELSEKQRKHFNNIEYNYEKAINNPKARYYRYLVYRLFFKGSSVEQMLNENREILVLEAMCGDGMGRRILKSLYKKSRIVYEGFDYSDEMIKTAQRKNPGICFFQKDINKFKSDKEYDIIILLSGLHHVPKTVQNVANNLYAHLKPGGCFISVEPTYNLMAAGLIGKAVYKHSKYYDYDTERRFSLKELNRVYLRAGFKIEKQLYPGLLGYLLWWFNPYPWVLRLGSINTVKRLFKLEKPLYQNNVGNKLSLATFTILRK